MRDCKWLHYCVPRSNILYQKLKSSPWNLSTDEQCEQCSTVWKERDDLTSHEVEEACFIAVQQAENERQNVTPSKRIEKFGSSVYVRDQFVVSIVSGTGGVVTPHVTFYPWDRTTKESKLMTKAPLGKIAFGEKELGMSQYEPKWIQEQGTTRQTHGQI